MAGGMPPRARGPYVSSYRSDMICTSHGVCPRTKFTTYRPGKSENRLTGKRTTSTRYPYIPIDIRVTRTRNMYPYIMSVSVSHTRSVRVRVHDTS
eukprot:SAG31_NODE_1426_length_8393_cov_3.363275_7_plen_95_part_00